MLTTIPFDYEMKNTERYIVSFPKEFDLESMFITACNKPKFINNKWLDIEIEFLDPVGPSTSLRLYNIISIFKIRRSLKYCLLNNKSLYYFFKRKMFTFTISALDPTDVEVEKWVIDVEDIICVDFGDYRRGSNENLKPRIIIKPLNCMLRY